MINYELFRTFARNFKTQTYIVDMIYFNKENKR